MRLGQAFRNLHHRGNPADQARGNHAPATPATATPTAATAAPATRSSNATAPETGSRTSSPRPPSYQTVEGRQGTPAPSFVQHPRETEQRLAISDFGDRLGRPPSETGSRRDFHFDQGSMNGLYPASERSRAPSNVSRVSLSPSASSSLEARRSHAGSPEPEAPSEESRSPRPSQPPASRPSREGP
jgi:hypothetical protein